MMSSAGQGLLLIELRLSQGSRQLFPKRIAEGRQLIYGDAIALSHEPDDRLSQQFIERWFAFNQCLILPALCLQAALTVG